MANVTVKLYVCSVRLVKPLEKVLIMKLDPFLKTNGRIFENVFYQQNLAVNYFFVVFYSLKINRSEYLFWLAKFHFHQF